MNDSDPGLETHPRQQRPTPLRQAPLRRPPLGLPAASELQGFVERGVDTAYTVIEAYMRRGQQAAQRVCPAAPEAAGPHAGANGVGGPGGLAGLGAALSTAGPWGATASSIAGPWLQLLRAWADAVAALGPLASRVGAGLGDALPPGFLAAGSVPPAATAAAAAPMAAPGPRSKVTVELVSLCAAAVAVSLEPGADLAALQADWLGLQGGPRPGSLQLYSEPGHVHLRLTLADPPTAGRHEASVTDSQGQTWGSVVVTIAPPAAAGGSASGNGGSAAL